MYNPNESGDRRQYTRYSVRENATAFVDSNINLMGKIEDIGMRGLAFRYLQLNLHVEKKKSVNINLILPKKNFSIEKIPVKVISDIEEMNKSGFSTVIMRRCSVCFDALTDHQSSKINYFIENFAIST